MFIMFGSIYAGSFYKAPLQGIAVGMLFAAIVNYYMMIVTLRKNVFPNDWKKLLLRPFFNGVPLTLYLVIPSLVLFYIAMFVTHNDNVLSFLITSAIVGSFLSYAFLKRPKMLGKDFAPIHAVLMEVAKKRKNKKKKPPANDAIAVTVADPDIIVQSVSTESDNPITH